MSAFLTPIAGNIGSTTPRDTFWRGRCPWLSRMMRAWFVLGLLGGGLPVLAQSEGPGELRLEIRLEAGAAAVVLHNTTHTGRYHILSKNSLAQEQWRVECELTGVAGSTATLIPLLDRPTLFLRAVEWPGPSPGASPGGFSPAAPAPCPSAVDALLLLDVSQSLSADDFLRAHQAVSNFVAHLDLSVDRVGLISFAAGAVIEQPLTYEGRTVQTNLLGIRMGTVLEPAITLAQSQLAEARKIGVTSLHSTFSLCSDEGMRTPQNRGHIFAFYIQLVL